MSISARGDSKNRAQTSPARFVRAAATVMPPASGAAAIVIELRRAILAGDYGYLDRLPAERTLCAHFGYSRGTVRSALRTLKELGLVSRHPGNGTYVCYRDTTGHEKLEIADITSPVELMEVRMAVEPQIARLAVLHAKADDMARMQGALERLHIADNEVNLFSRADEEFHLYLAEATHNPLMLSMYRQINDVRGHRQWDSRKDYILTMERIAFYNEQHRQLYDMLVSRNSDGMVSLIQHHLNAAQEDLLGYSADTK